MPLEFPSAYSLRRFFVEGPFVESLQFCLEHLTNPLGHIFRFLRADDFVQALFIGCCHEFHRRTAPSVFLLVVCHNV